MQTLAKPDKSLIRAFQRDLISWYENEFRHLPWRRTKDPYKIWVSEIMLQQTQVKKVIPYFDNFIKKFPAIEALAESELADVLKAWEGLGYYARARNLHKAAQEIVSRHDKKLPTDFDELKKLSGIGPYTAAAISSIVAGYPIPVLDGNVARVLSRLVCLDKNPKSGESHQALQRLAGDLLYKDDPGTYNQALMELGALLCTPVRPKCLSCPIRKMCQACQTGSQSQYPIKVPKKQRPHFTIGAGIIWKEDKILIARRHENGLLGGLWEFPGGKQQDGETIEQTVQREIKEEVDVTVRVDSLLAVVKHQYSHFKITLHAYHCTYVAGSPKALGCAAWKWVKKDKLQNYALPRANGKILELLLR
jgi:A/G-specific adenine glycosylase